MARLVLAEYIDGKACVYTFKLLGIWYDTTRRHRCHGEWNNIVRIKKMAGKLKLATRNVKIKKT